MPALVAFVSHVRNTLSRQEDLNAPDEEVRVAKVQQRSEYPQYNFYDDILQSDPRD